MSTILALLQAAPSATPSDLSWLPSLGVGGALASIMFWFYRTDRKASEERLTEVAKDMRTIIVDNTVAMTRVADAIDNQKR